MKLAPLIDHLKAKIPQFQDRIASLVEFKSLIETDARLTVPALYVMLGAEVGEPVKPQKQTYIQPVSQNIYVFLVLNNTRNQLGGLAQDQVDDFRTYLIRTLVNYWYIPQFAYPIEFVESDMAYMDAARYIHKFQFVLKSQIDFTDGWQEDEPPDLTGLFTDIDLARSDETDHPNAQVINNF